VVNVGVYLDRDGSRTLTALDTVFPKARVVLFIRGGTDTFKVQTVAPSGFAVFNNVPLGQYTVAVDPNSIGDSIQVQAIDSSDVMVTAADSAAFALARLGYPEVSIRQARSLPAGRRVFLRGIILAGVQSFRDTTSHLSDSTGALRLTRVALRGGLTGNNPATAYGARAHLELAGQPTLDLSSISRFGPARADSSRWQPARPPPRAARLDAALVQITGASSGYRDGGAGLLVTVSDGTGLLSVILMAISTSQDGLPPTNDERRGCWFRRVGGWFFKPRDLGDVVRTRLAGRACRQGETDELGTNRRGSDRKATRNPGSTRFARGTSRLQLACCSSWPGSPISSWRSSRPNCRARNGASRPGTSSSPVGHWCSSARPSWQLPLWPGHAASWRSSARWRISSASS
jgi:hypothetical protein